MTELIPAREEKNVGKEKMLLKENTYLTHSLKSTILRPSQF